MVFQNLYESLPRELSYVMMMEIFPIWFVRHVHISRRRSFSARVCSYECPISLRKAFSSLYKKVCLLDTPQNPPGCQFFSIRLRQSSFENHLKQTQFFFSLFDKTIKSCWNPHYFCFLPLAEFHPTEIEYNGSIL